MICTICGEEVSSQKSCNICNECEEKIDELSRKILKSHKKLTLRHIKQVKCSNA
ncbi:hypothetical protein [Sporohalobacter salinus]|uniref:hypothetical protein n=1 Tax=Sporohalobacter salinus TaxID=1494606 RepID=UPI001961CE51|nr:hypothetical protein [Sporohalobacter salinus]MBM7622689.1 Mg2+ and Co2+ transporter CorA [Sporohalobacter salinus]